MFLYSCKEGSKGLESGGCHCPFTLRNCSQSVQGSLIHSSLFLQALSLCFLRETMGHPGEIAPLSFRLAETHFLPPLEKEKHSKLTVFTYAMSILIKLRERVILSHIDTYISYIWHSLSDKIPSWKVEDEGSNSFNRL